jgi:CMP-N-acetylneuraminic acid synthetase
MVNAIDTADFDAIFASPALASTREAPDEAAGGAPRENALEVLAIIPARGGSKSIPRKNVLSLGGFPLIAYSIVAAQAAPSVSRVLVSTDDEEIAQVACDWGAQVPFMRPAEYSQDGTTDLPVFQHALTWLRENENYRPDIVVHLRPTSPFRRVAHIEDAVRVLAAFPHADAARTVCEPFQNPFKMWTVNGDGFLSPLMQGHGEEPYNQPRQSLPRVFWQTGYVDAARAQTIESGSMTGRQILPVFIDNSDWIDIDSPADWAMAENLLSSERLRVEALGFQMNAPREYSQTEL